MFIAHFIWFLIKLLFLFCKTLRGWSGTSVHGPSFPAAVPGLIPADSLSLEPQALGLHSQEMPTAGNFQLPESLVAAFTL